MSTRRDPAVLARAEAIARDPERLLRELAVPRIEAWLLGADGAALAQRRVKVELAVGAAGVWTVQLAGARVSVARASADRPDVIVEISEHDFAEVVLGALTVKQARVDGRLAIAGDASLIAKLAPLVARLEGVVWEPAE